MNYYKVPYLTAITESIESLMTSHVPIADKDYNNALGLGFKY